MPLPTDARGPSCLLLAGPGPRARDLAAVLAALGAPLGVETRAFGDLADLAHESGRGRLLLLDADAMPLEDVGFVRRFLAGNDVEVVLIGSAARAPSVRALGPRRFIPWPPDIEELSALVAAVSTRARDATSAASAPMRASSVRATPTVADDVELEQVRAILDADDDIDTDAFDERDVIVPSKPPPTSTREPVSREPLLREPVSLRETSRTPSPTSPTSPAKATNGVASASAAHERDVLSADAQPRVPAPAIAREANATDAHPFAELAPAASAPAHAFDDDPDVRAGLEAEHPPRPGIDAPPWWRSQVADLADAAQRIDLSVKMLAEAAPEIDEGELESARARLRELEGEVARLVQFTRTLGYVAAPPPAGSQTFDLGEIVHLFAAGLAQSGAEAPRCQYKTSAGATVRSDRQLLSQALDALFFLVRCTSKKGDLVRAQVQHVDADERAWVELALDFPSGPLAGLSEDEVVSPYALTDLFPELGPNALAAAAGIVAGQGGTITLASRAHGRMTWRLRLPRVGA